MDAGADEDVEENKSTDYGKVATAISNMQHRGIDIAFPLINEAGFDFKPDEKNNRIIYSLKAINGIGDDVVRQIMEYRPYRNFDDFLIRMYGTKIIKTSQVIQLIKAGAFMDSGSREEIMMHFIKTCIVSPVNKLGLNQFGRIMELNEKYSLMDQEAYQGVRHRYFKEYVLSDAFLVEKHIDKGKKVPKAGYHDRYYKLDKDAMNFFQQYYSEDSVVSVENESFIISEKKFIKENDKMIQPLRDWMNNPRTIEEYNGCNLLEAWEKYAEGTVSKWEMDSLSIYITEHELAHMQNDLYGVVNYFDLPEEPVVVDYYTKNIKQVLNGVEVRTRKKFPIYNIVRLAGTVIDKNKDRHTVTLLTTTGVVTLKLNSGLFLYYDKEISKVNENGVKQKIEKSWFTRGNKIIVSGYRNGDQFRVYKYANGIYKHSCCLITQVNKNGTIQANMERVSMEEWQ